MLKENGRLLIANFMPSNPDMGYMEAFMGWELLYRTREEFEQRYFSWLLKANNGNVTQSAESAGISRPYLHEIIKKLGLDLKQIKATTRRL